MAKETKPLPGGESGPREDGPQAQDGGPVAHGNTLQRASTVIRKLKLPAPVAAGVLAHHGLTRLSMVDPADFTQQVTDWLASPAQK